MNKRITIRLIQMEKLVIIPLKVINSALVIIVNKLITTIPSGKIKIQRKIKLLNLWTQLLFNSLRQLEFNGMGK